MGLLGDNESTARARAPEPAVGGLPKLVVSAQDGVPALRVSTSSQQPQFQPPPPASRGENPLHANPADAVLPKNFRGTHSLDNGGKSYEPSKIKFEAPVDTSHISEQQRHVNSMRQHDASRDLTQSLTMPVRDPFQNSESSLATSAEKSAIKLLGSVYDTSLKGNSNDNSILALILSALAYLLGGHMPLLMKFSENRRTFQRGRKWRRRFKRK